MTKPAKFGVAIVLTIGSILLSPNLLSESEALVIGHLFAGFWFFLRDSFSAISYDAGTWGPAVVAYLLALIIAHRFFSRWAKQTRRHWNLWTSVCVMLLIPVLFVIAFIVPGILLQWEGLREGPWISY